MNMMNIFQNYMNMLKMNNMNNQNNMNYNANVNNNNNQANNTNNNNKRINHCLNPNYQGPRINIIFKTTTGHTIMMNVPANAIVGDIIKEYFSLIGVLTDNGKIKFIFNAKRIKDEERNLPAQQLGLTNMSTIVVLDAVVIGA